MKQKYVSPVFEATELLLVDLLMASGELDNEVDIDGGILFQ